MLEQPERVWAGVEIIAGILGVKRIAVAIEDNKPDAIRGMEKAMQSAPATAQVVVLPTYYPQGAGKAADLCRDRPRSAFRRPADGRGCLVENAGTARPSARP